uniref:Glutamine amidotransferase type-2 domain-containing protein n=1 Tax=Ditylenchus dipsaci TaxID=166011 RepID=A0A915DJV7_9BILA
MNQKQCRRSWFIHRPSVFRKSSTLFAVNSEKSYSESAEVIANQYIDAGSSTSKIDSETAFSLYAVNKRPWFIYKPSVFNKSGAKSFAIPPELGTESFCRDSDLENASSPQGSENLVEIRDSENWFGRQPSVFKKSFQAKPEYITYQMETRVGRVDCNRSFANMCGILGMILAENTPVSGTLILPSMAVDCLTALQHRGTESSGLVGSDGSLARHFEIVKGTGLVRDVYTEENLAKLKDSVALIGHNRYSTAGMKTNAVINCIQPFVLHTTVGLIAIAHNGELVNAHRKRSQVLREGVGLSTDTDKYEVSGDNYNTLWRHFQGAVCHNVSHGFILCLLVMTHDRLYALRDPYGNRPLCIGKIINSSVDLLDKNANLTPRPLAEIFGYIATWRQIGLADDAKPLAFCIFEYVYFSRADSHLEGQQVHSVREECGRILAEEAHVDADIVSTVPESATAASIGYAQKSGIRYEQVLQRNTYVGRSFIQPNTQLRQSSVLKKFGVLSDNVKGKRIVLIDDSIVRGNTMGIIVRLLRQYGAKEVHLRIASPPLRYACYMGINIPSTEELIARKRSVEEIATKLQADSVQYLSVEGLRKAKVVHRAATAASLDTCLANALSLEMVVAEVVVATSARKPSI